jgi:hypothetical protein
MVYIFGKPCCIDDQHFDVFTFFTLDEFLFIGKAFLKEVIVFGALDEHTSQENRVAKDLETGKKELRLGSGKMVLRNRSFMEQSLQRIFLP